MENKDTAVAFVRDGGGEASFRLLDRSGNEVARKSISFPSGSPGIWHRAMFITELFAEYPGISEFEGSVRIGGAMAVMGLKARGSKYAPVPVVVVE